jgi:hypothetical protein
MNVLLVTSWGQPQCGIQAHSELLIDAVQQADPAIAITPSAAALDPDAPSPYPLDHFDILHLNYHRALHSRWTAAVVRTVVEARHTLAAYKAVVITFHDTFGEHPPDPLSQELCATADAFLVHEPCVGLERAIYWRMGVPRFSGDAGWRSADMYRRPTLGTIGFNFGWKNWPELARLTKQVGWGFLICTPAMRAEDEATLRAINPWLDVRRDLPTREVIAVLHECDATAFTNVCGNSGQSAAILLGIAARKPVIALSTCRQYRALFQDPLGSQTIGWEETFPGVENRLKRLCLGHWDPGIVALAEQDSWAQLGAKYAALYRGLVA